MTRIINDLMIHVGIERNLYHVSGRVFIIHVNAYVRKGFMIYVRIDFMAYVMNDIMLCK